MTTSLMPTPKQQYFSNGGIPLLGGNLYTYAAGTSTPKATYTDSAGTIPQPNPVPLNSRGEPDSPIYWSGAYKVVLQDIFGNTIYSVDNYNAWDNNAGLLRSDLAAQTGAGLVGWILGLAGSVKRFILEKLADTISVKDFGAIGDGVTDDTAAIQNAINNTSDGRPLRLVFPPSVNGYKMGKVLVPSNVTIDLCENLLIGTGGVGFESATWVGGVLTTNIGTAAESTLIRNTRIGNGRMQNYLKAFNLQDFIWGSAVHDIEFISGGWSIYAQRCFYSSFARLSTNGLMAGHAGCAYYFSGVNNLLEINGLTIANGSARVYGFDFSGNAADSNLSIINCGCEGMTDGMRFTSGLNSLYMRGNYFEAISGTAIDLSVAVNKNCIDIDNNWFYNIGNAVVGRFCLSGRWGVSNRIYTDGAAPTAAVIDFNDAYASNMEVQIPSLINFGNLTANNGLPSNYLIGKGCVVDYKRSIVNGAGNASIADIHTTSPIPLSYTGTGGTPDSGTIPFCPVTYPAGTSGSVIVDTWIPFASPDMVGVSFNILDTSGLWAVNGIIIGGNYINANPTGKTVTISNNTGFIRITVDGLASTTSTYTATGVVRIL